MLACHSATPAAITLTQARMLYMSAADLGSLWTLKAWVVGYPVPRVVGYPEALKAWVIRYPEALKAWVVGYPEAVKAWVVG